MPQSDQIAGGGRYTVIPRTATFLRRGDEFLLMKGAPTKKLWPGKYNGLGGHIERGEDVLSSARRELLEETGLTAELWLCGIMMIDAGETGICLFLFSGENPQGELRPSKEGMPEWIHVDALRELPVVEDLPILLQRIRTMRRGDAPFYGRSYYDDDGMLKVSLEE